MYGGHRFSCKNNAHKLRVAIAEQGNRGKVTPRVEGRGGYAMGGEGRAIEK